MLELLQTLGLQHGPVAAVAAVVAFFGNKHFKADHARFNRVEDSIGAGLDKVTSRLEAVSDKMDQNHETILKMLVSQNDRASLVKRTLARSSKRK